MNYGNIKSYDIADGTGVRVSLFVSGCRHHCKGCFNAPTWDFNYGKPFTRETQDKIPGAACSFLYRGLLLTWRRAIRAREPACSGRASGRNQTYLSG